MMQDGITPSVSAAAEAAGVSRATAYRCFPSEAALVHAVVGEGLGPILEWQAPDGSAADRVENLLATALPRIEAYEATFKAALRLSLDQWGRQKAGTAGTEIPFTRGHRIHLLREAIAPLADRLSAAESDRLAQALSLVFGIEVLLVLKDIWGLDDGQVQEVANWAAKALVDAALKSDS
jgi:AcrR family transcriptional regulator